MTRAHTALAADKEAWQRKAALERVELLSLKTELQNRKESLDAQHHKVCACE